MNTQPTWQRIGAWYGGTVFAVALSPNFATDQLALATTGAGVYRSMDGGETWTLSNDGLYDPSTLAISFAPQNSMAGRKVFVSTSNGRLFTSQDGGQTWAEEPAWAGLGVITTLAISPNYVQDQTLFVGTEEGVFRSQTDGQQWESSTFGLLDLEVLCLACAPDFASSEVLWAGTAQGGFYRSRNAGRSWRDAGAGLPDTAIQCVAVSPNFETDQRLLVGTETAGIYQSVDGGTSWIALSAELADQSIDCLAMAPAGHSIVASTGQGITFSTDGGKSWSMSETGRLAALSLGLDATGRVMAGVFQAGIYLSADAGQSWRQAVGNLAAHTPPVVALSPHGELFALDNAGTLAYSADQGAHWQAMPDALALEISAFAVAGEQKTTTLYGITGEGDLYRRPDNGTWACCLAATPDAAKFTLLAVSPNFARDQLLALGDEAGQIWLWSTTSSQPVAVTVPCQDETLLQLAFSPDYAADQALCAVTAQRDEQGNYRVQLWRSMDNAQSWANLAEFYTELPAVALAWPFDPTEQAIFLATRNRVIKLFIDPVDQQFVFEQRFLDQALQITALVAPADYAHQPTLYAATNQGVYETEDGGQSWAMLGQGLEGRIVVALLPTVNAALSAMTLGGEAWHLAFASRVHRTDQNS
ncbi:MAG: YCF48-related protein [Chloroflexi bacterium]|nr:YCF48-related protein [Chloroflexota bacterium]